AAIFPRASVRSHCAEPCKHQANGPPLHWEQAMTHGRSCRLASVAIPPAARTRREPCNQAVAARVPGADPEPTQAYLSAEYKRRDVGDPTHLYAEQQQQPARPGA